MTPTDADDIKPIFVSASERFAAWFLLQVREHGLYDVKFFPTSDVNATVEDCCEAFLAALGGPPTNGTPQAWESEAF